MLYLFIIIEILVVIILILLFFFFGVFVFGKKIIDVKIFKVNYKFKLFMIVEKSVVYIKDFFGVL